MTRTPTWENRSPDAHLHQATPPAPRAECNLTPVPPRLEVLLTSQEASQILKIHPKVLERMAKRGEVPALKVGKFWRYRATTPCQAI